MKQLGKVNVLRIEFVCIAEGFAQLTRRSSRPRNRNYLCFRMSFGEHSVFHQNALHATNKNGGI